MKLTSKDANKLLKHYEEELNTIRNNENDSYRWVAAVSENKEDVRPDYNYSKVQKEISNLENKIRKIKHAINVFNATTVVADFGMTIDEMLIYIPQLSSQKMKLNRMRSYPKFERVQTLRGSNIIEYNYTNYDQSKVALDYQKVDETLSKAQVALDKINITETFEIAL